LGSFLYFSEVGKKTSLSRERCVLFEVLQEKFELIFKKLRGEAVLNEKNIREALRAVKLALLEADVNFKVVKEFIEELTPQLLGTTVLKSFTPTQQVIKIVHQTLGSLLGEEPADLLISAQPMVILIVGLNGSGKTTTCAKLARYLKNKGVSSLLVATDTYRPAATKQLQILGERIKVPVFTRENSSPEQIAVAAIREAQEGQIKAVVVDTRGRLHVDEELMQELVSLKQAISPQEILLVADASTGQDAVNIARQFDRRVGLTGIILSKLDSEARGGAALSMRKITGKKIKFVGTGEKLSQLELFIPTRMASRILGMGDVLTLIEKTEKSLEIERAKKLEEKLKKEEEFTLEDFLEEISRIKKMGGLEELVKFLPGRMKMNLLAVEEKTLQRFEAAINSMTPEERRNPAIINGSRRKRISRGSGVEVQYINQLLKKFSQAQRLLRQLQTGKFKKMKLPFSFKW
jgi:signal recognition particle subunit SRP54